MRKTILVFLVCFALLNTASAQGLRTPPASTAQTVKQEFGLGSIELSYSRPSAKGRKIMGDLVPFGNVWRTGANGATTLTFSNEVTIGQTKVPAGKYGLLTIPDKDKWTVIITKQTDVTSPAAYKKENDVVRVEVKPVTLKDHVETFTIQFADITTSSLALQIMWEKTAVTLPITADVESVVMRQIDNIMNGDNRPYYQAAMYYLENGKDLNKAAEWFDKAVEQQPNAFWVWHYRASCLAKLGKKQEAISSANKSIELAKQAQNQDYVTLNEKLIASLK
jgi:hypothetical protein